MYRKLYENLKKWKDKPDRKPLILNGARQVGKTWLLKEFGKNEYKNLAYINCDNNETMKNAFFDYDTERLIRVFSAVSNEQISKDSTLIILDEIQEIPQALTALKYFQEQAKEYHIAVAGSLLGIKLHEGSGYPVGKVDEMRLCPMSFNEFVLATGENQLYAILKSHKWDELSVFKLKFIELLRQYYYVGGMPEIVSRYVESQDLKLVRDMQKRIIKNYKSDFSKHVPKDEIAKVSLIWDSIPGQLAKENRKFIYGVIRQGARAKEYENAIQWLIDAGLVYKVNRVSKVAAPTKFYEEQNVFKLFMLDLGLMGAMVDVPAKQVLTGNNIFEEYKGTFTEQYVAQQLIAAGIESNYYTNANSTAEIDFVLQFDNVYPIEVKAEENLKSKSLQAIKEKNSDIIAWRFSMSDYRKQDWLVNVPLYAVLEWVEYENYSMYSE